MTAGSGPTDLLRHSCGGVPAAALLRRKWGWDGQPHIL